MKIIIDKSEYWIKDDVILPSNFDKMSEYEKWNYIFDNKLLHREDGPAVIYSNGDEYWYLNGLCHRKDGPAIIWFDGTQFWYLNGKLHRLAGPAIIYYHGSKSWYLNDKSVEKKIYKKIEESSKEELLMYMVLPKYKDYMSLIEYRLNIL